MTAVACAASRWITLRIKFNRMVRRFLILSYFMRRVNIFKGIFQRFSNNGKKNLQYLSNFRSIFIALCNRLWYNKYG